MIENKHFKVEINRNLTLVFNFYCLSRICSSITMKFSNFDSMLSRLTRGAWIETTSEPSPEMAL